MVAVNNKGCAHYEKVPATSCSRGLSGSIANAQIRETVTPIYPTDPVDAQIQAVQQAETQIRATEQAVALEKAKAAERQAKANRAAQAKKRELQAKKQAEINAKKAKQEQYKDELMQLEIENKKLEIENRKLELEAKRSAVETEIDLNKARQERARDLIEKEIQSAPATNTSSSM